jgi:molybdate/tungstate transport system substrate-binding protein
MKFSGLIIKFFFFLLLFSCTPKKSENEKIIIFHAGSLAVPFSAIIDAYNSENPEIELYAESSGSLQAARKITDLHKECDMLAVSDYLVIDNMMIPEFAEWNFPFCTNEMVIAYNANSFKANEITSENWFSILNEEECIIGRSDPNADPCGYRSIFLFHLSESYYNEAGFAEKNHQQSQYCNQAKRS